MSAFLIQRERSPSLPGIDNTVFTPDAATVLESIETRNWMRQDDKIDVSLATFNLVQNAFCQEFLAKVVPVGSVEFVEAVLKRGHGIDRIKPQNVPVPLRKEEFLGRNIIPSCTVEEIPAIMDTWGADHIFVKSAERIKDETTGICSRKDLAAPVLQGKKLFVSEVFQSIISEWRVFVYRGNVIDLRPYTGDRWTFPDQKKVMGMVAAINNNLHAYTLDVAVNGDLETVVIEVHNFLACGLYGANVPLEMYKAAYNQELSFCTDE